MSRSALIICLSSAMPDRYQCLEAWTGFWWEHTQGYFSKSSRIWSVITMQLYGAAICQNTFLMTELSIDVIISWTSCNLRFFWLWLAALKCTTQNLILEFRAVAPCRLETAAVTFCFLTSSSSLRMAAAWSHVTVTTDFKTFTVKRNI